MAKKRFKEKVTINGETKWINGYSIQELFDNYVRKLESAGIIEYTEKYSNAPYFGDYINEYYNTFKKKQARNTIVNRSRIIRNHILPRFNKIKIDRITSSDIQKWFYELSNNFSKETILKIKNIINPVFDSAVEDDIISRNPVKSKRIEVVGRNSVPHKAMPREKMNQIKSGLNTLDERERYMGALLCYTGMRFEEVLGVRWEDLTDDNWIIVCRAVVHPTRNQPVIKETKTGSSNRIIPATDELISILKRKEKGYILRSSKDPAGEIPLSYSEARRSFNKIRKKFGIEEYSAHDFRDTCATEWRENGISLDVIARLLGHANTDTTEKRYVKYRDDILEGVRDKM